MYERLADLYDLLMKDVDYGSWVDYIEEILRRNSLKPQLVLDLGCGTGSFCMEMAARGYDMIGVDSSAQMLSCAVQKMKNRDLRDILYLNQDMTAFELYGSVDAVVCLMDSINYVTDKEALMRMFDIVRNYLNPDGVFIFDVNTLYRFENVFDKNTFYSVDEDATYIWENRYDGKNRICEFDITLFTKCNELYKRFDEIHLEKAYEIPELLEIIGACGLQIIDIYDELSFNSPHERSERIFFVCKKEGRCVCKKLW
jgi:SAM-dependent methyltransferase